MSKEGVIVVGCGVSGLTCGIRFLDMGYSVRIVAAALPPETTSDIAAAYWYPYAVFPKEKVAEWASYSYKKLAELSDKPDTGVSMVELVKIFDREAEAPYLRLAGSSFRAARADELPEGYTCGFVAKIPLIETPVYMPYLMDTFRESGGVIEELEGEITELRELPGKSDLVINCTGLGARKLCRDEKVFPIRGQLVRTTNPGLSRVINDELGPLAISYIVPRDNDCILGGTAEENNWSLDIDPGTSEEILHKCGILEPKLKDARVLEYRVGLRPGRTEVRLELEHIPGFGPVIHNYGHGGGGFTLSWGCAEEVLQIARGL